MFRSLVLLFVLHLCLVQGQGATFTRNLTKSYVTQTLVPAIRYLWSENKTTPGTTFGAIVRLTFHDCAGAGGCDGCVNTTLPENAGLHVPVRALEWLYANLTLRNMMSRADLWALAGIVAVNDRMRRTGPAVVDPSNFKYGRKDCAIAPNSAADKTSDFPSAMIGSTAVTSYFATRFNFSAEQTVAIMGAHHIGRMNLNYSGFNGAWVPGQLLNGSYYQQMINVSANWRQKVSNCDIDPIDQKVQWVDNRGVPCLNMLNADMALYKNIGTAQFNGAVTCKYATCPYAPTASFVTAFAADPKKFREAFAATYDLMISVCAHDAAGKPSMCTLKAVA